MSGSGDEKVFGMRSTASEVLEPFDLRSKVVIITGGASGIGLETSRAFAKKHAHLIIAARNREVTEKFVEELKAETGNPNIEFQLLDLASLRSVREFASAFLARSLPLHILIGNAAVMASPTRKTTEDGFELQFGTNFLGHFLLTNLLVPALIAGAPSRVVLLSSVGHRRGAPNLDDLNWEKSYDKWGAYGASKSATILYAKELNRRLEGKGVQVFSVHPGGIMTNLQKELTREEMQAYGWIDETGKIHEGFKTPEQGASTSCWAATSPSLEGKGGAYLEDCRVSETLTEATRDMTLAAELWNASEKLVGHQLEL